MEKEMEKEESNKLLNLSTKLLTLGDFSAARKYSLIARNSQNPNPQIDQIISVSDVLLAAGNRRYPNLIDYYSVLRIKPGPDPDWKSTIRNHFVKLFTHIQPAKDSLPFAQDAFELICEARSVLSDPGRKSLYDEEVRAFRAEKTTFWTVCPYCFYLFEYDRVYDGCCFRCQNCRKAFHGVAVEPPAPWEIGVNANGREEYYHGVGVFPIKYRLECYSGSGYGGYGGSGFGHGKGSGYGDGRGKGYVKSVPRGSRKMMGKGRKRGSGSGKGVGADGVEIGGGRVDASVHNDLQFLIREDDIYVGFKDEA